MVIFAFLVPYIQNYITHVRLGMHRESSRGKIESDHELRYYKHGLKYCMVLIYIGNIISRFWGYDINPIISTNMAAVNNIDGCC